jgi:hypothetical protein
MLRNRDASTNSTQNRGDLKQIAAKVRVGSLFANRVGDKGVQAMPRGDKSKYTDKQKRKAEHIEEGYEDSGVSKKEAERRAWATVNKESGSGKKSGSGRGKKSNKSASKKGGKKAGRKK